MTAPKLTRPHLALLFDLREGPRIVWENFRPRQKLIQLGYAKEVSGGSVWTGSKTEITPAGREHLANLQPHDLKP